MTKKVISIVIPFYNEQECLGDFLSKRLLSEVDKIKDYKFEIVLVDDGSSDNSFEEAKKATKGRKDVEIVALTRNFGKEAALSAGLHIASGDAVMMMDSDGQQPPEILRKFIEKWEKGADIITGVRERYTKHGLIAKVGSKIFYAMLHAMGNKSMASGSTDYRLLDRAVVNEYDKLSEHNRIARGLIDWMGFSQAEIEYVYGERMAGRPSYSFKKLLRLAIDSFVSFSTVPLMIFGYIGVTMSVISFILGFFIIIEQHILNDPLNLNWSGSLQLAILICFLFGLILISQMIISLYLSHVYIETQNRPLYIINKRKSVNLSKEDECDKMKKIKE